MGALAEIVISFLTLLEAEGRALRLGIAKVGIVLVLLMAVAALLLAGLGLGVWAIYLYLRIAMGPATAALLDGLIGLILAGFLLWQIKRIAR